MRCLAVSAGLLIACGDAVPLPTPEGVDVDNGRCGHAVVVLNSDYQSSSVAIVSYDGELLRGSIISSASETTGLSAPLSGDVVLPTQRTTSGTILLLDREQAVLTALDPVRAAVVAQVQLGTGFHSNPQDVVEVAPGKLYVSRYGFNANRGAELFDGGNDVVIVDRPLAAIRGRIDLSRAMEGASEGILPSPSRLLQKGDRVFLLLSAYSENFAQSDNGRIAVLNTQVDEVEHFAIVDGMRGCSALAISPNEAQLAVGCSGTFAGDQIPTLEDSGVVLFTIQKNGELVESARFSAQDLGGDPISFSVAFAGNQQLLLSTFGRIGPSFEQQRPDRLVVLDLGTAMHRELARTEVTPFSIGDVRCEAACGVCFAVNAETGGVLRIPVNSAQLGAAALHPIDDGIGLPPRFLGGY